MASKAILFSTAIVMGLLVVAGCIGNAPPQNQTGNHTNASGCVCTLQYAPVCGTDGATYGNACAAGCANATVAHTGACTEAAPCSDSDGGKDIFMKGTLQTAAGSASDSCKDAAEVDEYYCEGNMSVKEALPCPADYECLDGACKAKAQAPSGNGCTDSDGGQSFETSGEVEAGDVTYTDYCTDLQLVKEYYCDGNTAKDLIHPCDSNERCMDGRCVEAERFCTETDSGEDIYHRGAVSVGTIIASDTMTDTCEDGRMREYYCSGTTAHSSLTSCPSRYECRNGACREIECTDTDDGQDRNEKGTATDALISGTDACASGTAVNEYYCSGNTVQSTTLACASGQVCSDGRCIAETCSDTDGGWNTHAYGEAVRGAVTAGDSCAGDILTEYYCLDGNIASTTNDCAGDGEYCLGGECVPFCTDTDGGIDTGGPAGTVTRGTESKTDYCVDLFTAREFFCDSGGNIGSTDVACAGSCDSGVCIY